MMRATTSAVRRRSSASERRLDPNHSYTLISQIVALVLGGALLLPPAALAARTPAGGASSPVLSRLGARFNSNFAAMLSLFGLVQSGQPGRGKRPTPERPLPPRVAPGPPPTKAEREARVARLEVGTQGPVRLEPGQRMHLGAVPLDAHGDAVHGLVAEWESSRPAAASVTALGWVTALQPGTAQLTATAGDKRATVPVIVEEPEAMAEDAADGVAARERAGGVQFVKASLARRARPRSSDAARHARGAASLRAALVQGPSGEGPLPDAEAESLYSPENDVGAPRGRTEPGATVAPAAVAGTETPLSANFMFGIPLTGAPTRGIDLGLALTYNSRLWHRSTDSGGVTRLTYSADSSWMAPGFTIGFGEIEPHGTFFTLREADGTRRKLAQVSGQIYETGDGTFIRYEGSTLGGQLTYPNGTRVNYQATPSSSSPTGYLKRLTPVSFTDRNGNYSDVVIYSSGGRARVSSFRDSMGRYTRFRYDYGNNDLVAITAPGYAGGGDRLVARFYYEDLPVNANFQLPTRAPGTARVLRYVYFDTDGIGTGYRFDYSSYGMIYRIKMLRGMTISHTGYDQTGAVTGEGQTAATTEYNYPTGPGNLADAPQFTRRTDDWSSRTTGMGGTMEAPYHVFAVNQSQGVSTVTAADGTLSETRAAVNPGQWNDGLVTETSVKVGSVVLAKVATEWEHDGSSRNHRPKRTEVTNDAGQITSATYDLYGSYNNLRVMRERGFGDEELRRTEIEYETGAAWVSNRLLHLPTSVKIFGAGQSGPASRVEYAYDTAGTNLVPRSDLIMFDAIYNPIYGVTSTDYRGNVRTVTRYVDAAAGTGAEVDTFTYDIAGNLVTETADCCRQRSYTYTKAFEYAYATEVARGDAGQLRATVNYDFNTGLVRSVADENNQTTTNHFYQTSLRFYRTERPDGGYVYNQYFDQLYPNPDPEHTMTGMQTTTLMSGSSCQMLWKII